MLKVSNIMIELSLPRYVKINDFMKVNLHKDYLINYGVPLNKVKDLMSLEEIKSLRKINDNYLKDKSEIHEKLIINYLDKSKNKKKLKDELFENTFYQYNFEYWNITNLARKYNISGEEVLDKLIKSDPFNMGFMSYEPDKEINIKKLFKERKKEYPNSEYFYCDYINGIGIKNNFPLDINQSQFKLSMRRYNDRNNYNGYDKVLSLIEEKINNKPQNFIRYECPEPNESKNQKLKEIDNNIIKKNNNIIKKIQLNPVYRKGFMENLESEMIENIYDLEEIRKEHFDFNEIDLSNYFDLIPNIEYSTESLKHDLDTRLKNSPYYYVPKSGLDLGEISMVNLLLYSKSNINRESLPYLLEYIRINEKDQYRVQLDNYYIEQNFNGLGKNYHIEFKDVDLKQQKFVETSWDKYLACKYLLRFGEEVEPSRLNLHNYNIINNYETECCLFHNRTISTIDNYQNNIKNYFKKLE